MRNAVVTVPLGRFNPPHKEHENLINAVLTLAKRLGADAKVFVSKTVDNKKNPLTAAEKIRFLNKMYPGNSSLFVASNNPIESMKMLSGKYKKVYAILGDERVPDMKRLFERYNGKEYNFDEIIVKSRHEIINTKVGDLDGVHASDIRKWSIEGNFEKVKESMSNKLKDNDIKSLMNLIQKRLGSKVMKEENHMDSMNELFTELIIEQESESDIEKMIKDMQGDHLDPHEHDHEFLNVLMDEDEDEDEEAEMSEAKVLSIAQRQKLKQRMKVMAKRYARLRKMKAKRMAPADRLRYRSRKAALMLLRKRVAGNRGVSYHSLSPSQRVAIDKSVKQRFGKSLDKIVDTISKRTLPFVRKKEMARLAKARGGSGGSTSQHNEAKEISINPLKDNPLKTISIKEKPYKDPAHRTPVGAKLQHDDARDESYIPEAAEQDSMLTPKVNMLLRLGLVDPTEIEKYRRALKTGEKSLSSPELRSKMLTMLDKVLKLSTQDPVTYNRLRQMVIKGKQMKEEKSEETDLNEPSDLLSIDPLSLDPAEKDRLDAIVKSHKRNVFWRRHMVTKEDKQFASLLNKSFENDIPFEEIQYIYNEAKSLWNQDIKISQEEYAFNAVNSFVAEVKKATGKLKDACWTGYTAVGMKMKNGRKVPNCVPVKEDINALFTEVLDTKQKKVDYVHKAFASGNELQQKANKESDPQKKQRLLDRLKKRNQGVIKVGKQVSEEKHRVSVVVTDPHHTMVTQRNEKQQRYIRVGGGSPEEAVNKAKAHYKSKGFKVHDAMHVGMVNETGGAGYEGTDEVRKTYCKETPGQQENIEMAPHCAPVPFVDEADEKKDTGKSVKLYDMVRKTLSGKRGMSEEFVAGIPDAPTAIQLGMKPEGSFSHHPTVMESYCNNTKEGVECPVHGMKECDKE